MLLHTYIRINSRVIQFLPVHVEFIVQVTAYND